jgi:hypothetical protein
MGSLNWKDDIPGYSSVASSVILVFKSFDTGQPAFAMTPKDRSDLDAALETGIDWVALSFVQRAKMPLPRPRPFPPHCPPPPTPRIPGPSRLCSRLQRYYEHVRLLVCSPTASPSSGFLSRSGIAMATADQTRSPKFRCVPFARDGVFDPMGLRPRRSVSPSQSGTAHIAFSSVNGLGLHDIVLFAAQ